METIKMSVKDLVEYVYQCGDLVSSFSSLERAQIGSQIHRKHQSLQNDTYQSEVFLSNTSVIDDFTFVIEGRADGIIHTEDEVIVEEIKTTTLPYDKINDQNKVHFAQCYCYAYFYALQHDVNEVTIRLTYYQINEDQSKTFDQKHTLKQLQDFYNETLQHYILWAKLASNTRKNSQTNLKKLVFPYPSYRHGQRELSIHVYQTISNRSSLFVQAPTGIGKTISTLFPALKAIGEGKCEKIFYICAKNITAQVASNAIEELYKQNLAFYTVWILAKDKICFQEQRNCDPNECPYAKGYYDRNKDALYDVLTHAHFINQDQITKYAKKHKVCPFELQLDATLYSDVILCDYNYVFDPRVYLKRFFMERGNYTILIDEAHNLVDRSKEMYSASLSYHAFQTCYTYISDHFIKLLHAFQTILDDFAYFSKTYTTFHALKEEELDFIDHLNTWIVHMAQYFDSAHDEQHDEPLHELYFAAIHYIRISSYYDDDFCTCFEPSDDDFIIKLFCMNASTPICTLSKKVRSTIFFSATLSPFDYYCSMLSLKNACHYLSLPSPFPRDHFEVFVVNTIKTTYHERKHSLFNICKYTYSMISQKTGNYILFAPSYVYMKQIYDCFCSCYPQVVTRIQTTTNTLEEKQAFLQQFEHTEQLTLTFCVNGGMYSEGIDLKGDQLIGVIMVGVGLPQINPYSNLVKDHFNQQNKDGYAYAYQYPGMNKVVQSLGRLIRSEQDRGVLLLIDERYTTTKYHSLLPYPYQSFTLIHNSEQLQQKTLQFWQKK